MKHNITKSLYQATKQNIHYNMLRFLSNKEISYCLQLPAHSIHNTLQPLLHMQKIPTYIFRKNLLYGINLESLCNDHNAIKERWYKLKNTKMDPNACQARMCYSHLAGSIGVDIYSFFLKKNYINLTANNNAFITTKGIKFLHKLGIYHTESSQLITNCLDWTERRFHIGGSLGKELYKLFIKYHLVSKINASRALLLSDKGKIIWQHLQQI